MLHFIRIYLHIIEEPISHVIHMYLFMSVFIPCGR